MLKQDPNIWRLRVESVVYLLLSGSFLWNVFNNLYHEQNFANTTLIVGLLYSGALLYALYSVFVRRERYWKRLNWVREDAADHKESYLAAKQPDTDASSLDLPATITIRPGKLLWVLLSVLGIGPAIAVLVIAIITIVQGQLDVVWFIAGVVCVLALAVGWILFYEPSNNYCPKFVINDEGITAHYLLRRASLRWSEARLFASYSTYGRALFTSYISINELSGEPAFISWSWSVLNNPWWTVRVNGRPVDAGYSKLFVKQFNRTIVEHSKLPLCELVVAGMKKTGSNPVHS
ncbi:hypothetical protein [Dictyobacter aurantiacus]|uniref:Uncharacterized protein n=1 Tax=Dictyobacter aurantiacus TaxID=1936993 RepID=A0A401ZP53_9CHLR|nr:hypothetical protein [Dictyobacter aurantiacus]GCE08657.1 hypothetical protein KDAU_59860 [Dictyobacter aurantiacus]